LNSLRAKPQTRKLLLSKYLKEYDGLMRKSLMLCHVCLRISGKNYDMWAEVRDGIQRSYGSEGSRV
jgi:hypothetical protein